MKTIYLFLIIAILAACLQKSEGAFWGNIGAGYSNDDNFYKDVYKNKNAGYYYSLNLNAKNKISSGLQYDAAYLLLGRRSIDLTWEDNLINDLWLNVLTRPSDVFNVRLLTFYENKDYQDDYTKIYSYNQYKAGIEVPVYVFDYTTPKIGYAYEGIAYNDFNYDSTAIGPQLEIQQEFSSWISVALAVSVMDRGYSKQNLYDTITTTTATGRKDTETSVGLTMSSVITRDWSINAGIKHENVKSNANFPAFNALVAVSSRTLVDDYYSNSIPTVYIESVFYPTTRLRSLVGITYQEKAYSGRFATDSYGNLLAEKRKDKRLLVTVGVNYKISGPIAVKVDYTYENSASNDYIYTYTNNVISAGVNFYF